MPFSILAQNYRNIADSLFSNLNKSGATTGILYDRVYPLAGLQHGCCRYQFDVAFLFKVIANFTMLPIIRVVIGPQLIN